MVDALWEGRLDWEEWARGRSAIEKVLGHIEACEGFAQKGLACAHAPTWGASVLRPGCLWKEPPPLWSEPGFAAFCLLSLADMRIVEKDGEAASKNGRSALEAVCSMGPSGRELLMRAQEGDLWPSEMDAKRAMGAALLDDMLSAKWGGRWLRGLPYDEEYSALEGGLASKYGVGSEAIVAARCQYIRGMDDGVDMLYGQALAARSGMERIEQPRFWVDLMRLSPSGPVGQAVIARLRETSCDIALVLLQNLGDVRSARAVLVEGGEAALDRFEERNNGASYANAPVTACFEELMRDARMELKARSERTVLSELSAHGSRPKKSRPGL
jgi:hypothetical protein